jgi:hypothetical protein
VVLISQSRVPIPAKVDIGVSEQGEENIYIVKVRRCFAGVAAAAAVDVADASRARKTSTSSRCGAAAAA